MRIKSLLLWSIFIIVVGVILGSSTWHQWSANQETALERMRPIRPLAVINHGAWIQGIAFSPTDPGTIATASEGNIVKVWNIDNHEEPILTLTGDTDDSKHTFIDCLAFSPNGEWLASKTYMNLNIWEMPKGNELITTEIHSYAAAISSHKPILATAERDVRVWDLSNPNEITNMYVLPPKMGTQALTPEEAESLTHRKVTRNQSVDNVVFSKDHKWFAASGTFHSKTYGKRLEMVKIWDLDSKKLVKLFEREKPDDPQPKNYNRDIQSIKFSQNNRFFAATGKSGLTIWSLPEWEIYHEVLDEEICDVAISPNEKTFAITDWSTVTLWSVANLTPIAVLKDKIGYTFVDKLVFSEDGKFLAAGGWSGILWIWDVSELYEN